MRTTACLFVLAACGGASTAPKTATNATPSATPIQPVATTGAATPPPTIEQVCDRVDELQHAQCGAFGRTLTLTPLQCNQMFTDKIPQEEVAFRAKTEVCIMKPECQQVSDCLADLSKPDPTDLRECSAAGDNAVGVSAAAYAQRNGSAARKFTDVKSTKADPIERCGIENANAWLATLTCSDGSHPITDGPSAESYRAGNVGKAGRCNSIIDDYRVTCADSTTEIFIDAYVCPK
ncbi:MAG TPA: hypothetical protein VGM90_40470 [Kofleriaceae bacterium]|jgi:hypothetical protein